TQFNATTQEELLGMTPAQFFAHDVATAKERWREFFDLGYLHTETDERRLDGTPLRIEGDYMVIYDESGRIAGHFGIQRDVTDKYKENEQIRVSREQLRALASRLQKVREEERTEVAREIHDELGQALTGLKLDIAWMKNRLPRDHEMMDQCVSVIQRIDQTLNAVRRIATSLRPSVLDQHRDRRQDADLDRSRADPRRAGQLCVPDSSGITHQHRAPCQGDARDYPPRSDAIAALARDHRQRCWRSAQMSGRNGVAGSRRHARARAGVRRTVHDLGLPQSRHDGVAAGSTQRRSQAMIRVAIPTTTRSSARDCAGS